MAIEPATRQVRALVGGNAQAAAGFNRAIQAQRQPGSAFKPFVWGAAVESRRFTPATVVYDTPDVFRDPDTGKEWKPSNFEKDEFDGPMLLKAALAHSKNTVSVKLADALGLDAVAAFARRLGVESDLPRNLTMALGTGEVTPLELTNAYATIAAQGRRADAAPRPEGPRPRRPAPGRLHGRAAGAAGEAVALPAPAPRQDEATARAPRRRRPGGRRGPARRLGPHAGVPPPGHRHPARRGLRAHRHDARRGRVRHRRGGPGARAGPPRARPAPPRSTATPGSSASPRTWWPGVWIGFDDHAMLGPRETGAVAALPAWLAFMQAALGARPAAEFPRCRGGRGGAHRSGHRPAGRRPGAGPARAAGWCRSSPARPPPRRRPGPSSDAPQSFFLDDR